MRKIVLVICEGETEESYVQLLKNYFHSPIKIIAKKGESGISSKFIKTQKDILKVSNKDSVLVCLMYDMDVPATTEKLNTLEAMQLLSNPCFELWLLLHSKNQKVMLSTTDAIKELKLSHHVWNAYNKGHFSEPQKSFLIENMDTATERAKMFEDFANPSTGVYKLIELLKKSRKNTM